MRVGVIIATYGDDYWRELAHERAWPSVGDHMPVYHHHARHDGATIAQARNAAAEMADDSDWLCFLDADDELAPGFLDAMERAWEQERKREIDSSPLGWDGQGTPLPLLTPAVQQIKKGRPGRPFFFPECSFETGNWLIIGTLVQKDLFMEVGGFRDHPHGLEDWNLWARCVKAGARIVKVPKAVYIAHWNAKSKHHVFARNRPEYMKAYELARVDVEF